MKRNKIIIPLLFILVSILTMRAQKSEAKGVVIWGIIEKIKKIADLPDSSFYKSEDGKYFDFGVKYSSFHIFWVPLWITQDPVTCGYIDVDNYVILTDQDVKDICTDSKIDLNGKVKATVWDRFGGKVILLVFIFLAITGYFMKDDEEEKEKDR